MRNRSFFLVLIVFTSACFFSVEDSYAMGPTYIRTLDRNNPTVWTKENSPYVIQGWVTTTQPLTVEPGVIIKLEKYAQLMTWSSLNMVGTNDEKIVVTSIKDDVNGGDTNNDKNDTTPLPGDWKIIGIYGNSTSHIENVVFLYGSTQGDVMGSLSIYTDNTIVKNCEFKHSGYSGLFLSNAHTSIVENNIFTDNLTGILLYYSNLKISSNIFLNNKTGISLNVSSPSSIENNLIANNTLGIIVSAKSNPKIVNNAIYDNFYYGIMNKFPIINRRVDAANNWWGDVSGPYYEYDSNYQMPDNTSGKGNPVSDGVVFFPWLGNNPVEKEAVCQQDCFSNVMFLPGHQASRLYRKTSLGTEDQLWEPTNHNQDVEQLFLNENGDSIDDGIYTREILDEAFGFADNVYKKFIFSMDDFVQSGAINEWRAFPYDWRMSLESIVNNGTKLENGEVSNVIKEIRELATNSKNGKVALIGHSNGGLLGKVVIDKLKETGEENLIDKFVMVGTPQLGTPKAFVGLMHGDGLDLAKGIILDKKTAREFGENMVSAYNLLPSKKYFDVVQSPIVRFSPDVKDIFDFISIYGEKIDKFLEYRKFVLGDEGKRDEPKNSDTDSPNVLDEDLIIRAEQAHERLDSWVSPEGIETIQIAGWGLDTISGIEYDDCDILFCPDNLSNLDRKPIFTADGDGTVVVPSAVQMDGVERYYLDLKKYNSFGQFKINREHADILEVRDVQVFLKNIIENNRNLVGNILANKPETESEDKRLRYSLHSPVSLHLYDENGNHTGLIKNLNPDSDIKRYEEQIPNSYYMEFGEAKYAGSDGSFPQKVELEGEDLGTFTFNIDEFFGSGEIKNTTFENIPVVLGMKAEIEIADSVGKMKIDVDGDSSFDIEIDNEDGISKSSSTEVLKKVVETLDMSAKIKDKINKKLDDAKKQFEKENETSGVAMLKSLIQQIEIFSQEKNNKEFNISEEDSKKLINIIKKIIEIK